MEKKVTKNKKKPVKIKNLKKKKIIEKKSDLIEAVESEELSEIAEAISEDENSDEESFEEFFQTRSRAPVLEEIAGEQGVTWTRNMNKVEEKEEENEKQNKYGTGYTTQSASKYESPADKTMQNISEPKMMSVLETNKIVTEFIPVNEELRTWKKGKDEREEYSTAEFKAIEKEERKLPFQRDAKYKFR